MMVIFILVKSEYQYDKKVPGEDTEKNVKPPYKYYFDVHFKFRLIKLSRTSTFVGVKKGCSS